VEERLRYLQPPRVLWAAAALTVAAAVLAVLIVREIAVRIIHLDPTFSPLDVGSDIVATTVCTIVAVYIFVGMVSYPNPVRTWRRTSIVVVILSFAPCVLLAISHLFGGRWPEAVALMAIHAAVWVVCATLLPWLTMTKDAGKAQPPGRPLSIL
jgi:lysylphosphatidylglycerol synthetase-like protein (DUF2156 family)